MSERTAVISKKSDRRIRIVDQIMDALKGKEIYKTIDYYNKKEDYIKQYMHRPLLSRLERIHAMLAPGQRASSYKRKATRSLLWEGDVTTTVNNFVFFGVQHRPDFIVKIDGLKIAVEVKRGDNGSAVREGIGQSIVYAAAFDFVCYIFIDTSKDKKVLNSLKEPAERFFVETLWNSYNIRFDVVCR